MQFEILDAKRHDRRAFNCGVPELNQNLQQIHNLVHDEDSVYFPEFQDNAHRYYFVHSFVPTNFVKTTKGGMMGHRYFDLKKFNAKSSNKPAEIAEQLKSMTFEYARNVLIKKTPVPARSTHSAPEFAA